jgi:hypothetical protein
LFSRLIVAAANCSIVKIEWFKFEEIIFEETISGGFSLE